MSDAATYLRAWRFPIREKDARARLKKLKREAAVLGHAKIAKRLDVVCAAWDREVEIAQIEADQRGQESSIGVDHA